MKDKEVKWKEDSDRINDMLEKKVFNTDAWNKKDKFDDFLDDAKDPVKPTFSVKKSDKPQVDKEKVKNKLRNLTDEEKKKIIEDKQAKANKSAETKQKTGENTSFVFNLILCILANTIGYLLVGMYYLGMCLAFCLLPMPVYDYIHVDNGVDSFGFTDKGKKFSKREKLAKPYGNRDLTGNVILGVVGVVKIACWVGIVWLCHKYIYDYTKPVLYVVIAVMVYSLLPVYKLGISMLKKWKEHKENRAKQEKKKVEPKTITENDITKKDIIKYFHDEVLVEDGTLDTTEVETYEPDEPEPPHPEPQPEPEPSKPEPEKSSDDSDNDSEYL